MTDENAYLFFKYYFVHTYKNLNNLNYPCIIIIAFCNINEGFGPKYGNEFIRGSITLFIKPIFFFHLKSYAKPLLSLYF